MKLQTTDDVIKVLDKVLNNKADLDIDITIHIRKGEADLRIANKVNVIEAVEKELKREDLTVHQKAEVILHSLNMSENLLGYQYILEAVDLIFDKYNGKAPRTLKIYDEVSAKVGDTHVSRVERAIRYCIEFGFKNDKNFEYKQKEFGHLIPDGDFRPRTGDFLMRLVTILNN